MSISYTDWRSPGGTLTRLELVFPDGGSNTKEYLEKLRLECREAVGRYFDNRILNAKGFVTNPPTAVVPYTVLAGSEEQE